MESCRERCWQRGRESGRRMRMHGIPRIVDAVCRHSTQTYLFMRMSRIVMSVDVLLPSRHAGQHNRQHQHT